MTFHNIISAPIIGPPFDSFDGQDYLQAANDLRNVFLRKPSDADLLRLLKSQQESSYSYVGVGATADESAIPPGYVIDRMRVTLGRGESIFAATKQGLAAWSQFDLGWCEAWPRTTPIRTGEVVAVVAWAMGLCWTNASRIVYVVDEPAGQGDDATIKFGFAYGTLPGHVEMGEELFLVEWNRATDVVTYSILAFSRPRQPLARLGRPLVRRLQRRFREDSAAAMERYVQRNMRATSH
jgi:uncharacterized protein (UPF0548 family)